MNKVGTQRGYSLLCFLVIKGGIISMPCKAAIIRYKILKERSYVQVPCNKGESMVH
jgi:hypothetical protein